MNGYALVNPKMTSFCLLPRQKTNPLGAPFSPYGILGTTGAIHIHGMAGWLPEDEVVERLFAWPISSFDAGGSGQEEMRLWRRNSDAVWPAIDMSAKQLGIRSFALQRQQKINQILNMGLA